MLSQEQQPTWEQKSGQCTRELTQGIKVEEPRRGYRPCTPLRHLWAKQAAGVFDSVPVRERGQGTCGRSSGFRQDERIGKCTLEQRWGVGDERWCVQAEQGQDAVDAGNDGWMGITA